MFVDLPLEELQTYRPEIAEPPDFGAFWAGEVAAAREHGGAPELVRAESPIRHADVFDVTFPGHGGAPIRAWLLAPRDPAPGAAFVVEYVGYGGGRGDPLDWLGFSSAGHPHLIMDLRGQGGGWRGADTPDPGGDGGAPSTPGFLTRGIADPHTHYYTRLYVDAVRAVDAARAHPLAADRPIVATGTSQGGALAIVAAHLADVAATMPNVPFLAHPRRGAEITKARPYRELAEFCSVNTDRVDDVFATLAYMDVVNHGRHASVPALFAVGLLDEITPASTVFAAYNHYAGEKDIAVYPFNGHEGGGTRHLKAQLAFLSARSSPAA